MRRLWFFVITSAVIFLFNTGYADYGFDFYCRSDTFQQVGAGFPAYFYFTLVNTGTEPDVYQFDCQVLQAVPGWSVIYCLRGRCVEPGVPMFDTLGPGEVDSTIDVTVFTTENTGEEVVRLLVVSLGNPAMTKAVQVYTEVCGAVEEVGGGCVLPEENIGGRYRLFDPLGRQIKSINRRGVFFLLSEGGGGVKKVVRIN